MLLAVAGGDDYQTAARSAGRRSGDAVSHLVARFNAEGLAAWSLSTLKGSLRSAPDGLPGVATSTIWQVLHEAGQPINGRKSSRGGIFAALGGRVWAEPTNKRQLARLAPASQQLPQFGGLRLGDESLAGLGTETKAKPPRPCRAVNLGWNRLVSAADAECAKLRPCDGLIEQGLDNRLWSRCRVTDFEFEVSLVPGLHDGSPLLRDV